jgi:starch phosphorylase
MDMPGWGYGIRYTYGMFHQAVKDGYQVEFPDYWLIHGNPWEIERLDVTYPVKFYGRVHKWLENGVEKSSWEDTDQVVAVAYDVPIPGYKTYNTLNIRLWSAKPSKEFDLGHFNRGDFFRAIEDKQRAEGITHVLYPNDHTPQGQELRLKQQYFFVSATLQDLIRRFRKYELPWTEFPEKVAIQLNDTHPTLALPELLRIFVDLMGLSWDEAWKICKRTFSYTNHTVLPEALEKWPVGLLEHLLPRHMEIIYLINHRFLNKVSKKWPEDPDRLGRMSIIEEGDTRKVRMAFLATIGSHTVNGVAALHTEILKDTIFKEFCQLWPKKFQNKTNGVTPRRWIYQANPDLALLLSAWTKGEDWLTHTEILASMKQYIDNPQLMEGWMQVKRMNKERLASYIKKACGISVNVNALFDVQVKRFHEYKRQLLNILR